jgi:hypothetical protein
MNHLHKNVFYEEFKKMLIKKIRLDKYLSTKEKNDFIDRIDDILNEIKKDMNQTIFLKKDLNFILDKIKGMKK